MLQEEKQIKKSPPSGIVTFLFTDIEGSTRLAQDDPDLFQDKLDKHHIILKREIESHRGCHFRTVGDAFCVSFANAVDALNAAIESQKKFSTELSGEFPIKVRMGIHTGPAEYIEEKGDYIVYITLAREARVMSVAYGGQILVTEDTIESLDIELCNGVSFRDLGERKLKDLREPIHLYQVLSDGLQQDFPSLKTLDARLNNLPIQLTGFIGREDEMREVKDLLKKKRLLTLTGSGGAGKTRLALQVAADIIDDFANGVWFVELASLSEPDFLPQAIMKVFDLKEESKRTPEDILCDYLRDKEILVILDNCEHLIGPCAKLVEKLLRNSNKLKIITTSRETLRCHGEQTHRVLPLNRPDPREELSAEELSEYDAVKLFMESAFAVDKDFRMTEDNAQAIAGICHRLDGIPLAIELAAARVNIMSVEGIYEKLNDRFNLLTGGKRTALKRQQTLRATIDWSYDLLSEKEKLLWQRLSVFTGGWTLKAAKRICVDSSVKGKDILDLLSGLIEKSIIFYDKEKDRFKMLETLKQYGEEKLKEAYDVKDLLSRHLQFYLDLSEKAETKLNGSKVQFWLDKLETELDNFKSAFDWSVSRREMEKGARLVCALGDFWFRSGNYSTGRLLLDIILESDEVIKKSTLGKVLEYNGKLSLNQGQFEQSLKFYERSLALRKEIGDKGDIARSFNNIADVLQVGNLAQNQNVYEESRKYFEEALKLNLELGDKRGIAASLNGLGNVAYNQLKYKEAEKFYEESLVLRREIEDKLGIANSVTNLANIATYHGKFDIAEDFERESLKLRREMGERRGIALALHNLGNTMRSNGNCEEALKYHGENMRFFRELGDKIGISRSLSSLGSTEMYRENHEEAKKYFEECLPLFKEIGDKRGIANSLNSLGNIEYYTGNFELAKQYYEQALELRTEIQDMGGIAITLNGLGNFALDEGNYQDAQKLHEESSKIFREMEEERSIAYSLCSLARVAVETRNYEEALKLIKESLILYREVEDKRGIVLALVEFAEILSSLNQQSHAVIILAVVDEAIKSLGTILVGEITVLIRDKEKARKQMIKKLQDKLDDDEFSKYFEEGKKMTLEEAVVLALRLEVY